MSLRQANSNFSIVFSNPQKVLAAAASLTLHLALLILLLPAKSSLGTIGGPSGLGDTTGVGVAVMIVSDMPPSPSAFSSPHTAPSFSTAIAASPTVLSDAIFASSDVTMPRQSQTSETLVQSRIDLSSPAGADGNNGTSSLALWNAIAPCWNRIANTSTLPASLKITFDAQGQLAQPPEIERAQGASITEESLRAEAKALQALAECGSYPMAQGQANVIVQFPTPTLMAAIPSSSISVH